MSVCERVKLVSYVMCNFFSELRAGRVKKEDGAEVRMLGEYLVEMF